MCAKHRTHSMLCPLEAQPLSTDIPHSCGQPVGYARLPGFFCTLNPRGRRPIRGDTQHPQYPSPVAEGLGRSSDIGKVGRRVQLGQTRVEAATPVRRRVFLRNRLPCITFATLAGRGVPSLKCEASRPESNLILRFCPRHPDSGLEHANPRRL